MTNLQVVQKEYLGVEQAGLMTGMSPWTWRRWAYAGKVASVKLGNRLLIPRSEIERLIAENLRPAV
jgi:Helix-turn-helix domain